MDSKTFNSLTWHITRGSFPTQNQGFNTGFQQGFQPRTSFTSSSEQIVKKWDLFPRKFVKGYSCPKAIRDDYDLLQRITPSNCEWFRRPGMAMSFLADTISQCKPIIANVGQTVFKSSLIRKVQNATEPIMESLNSLNNKMEDSRPTHQDVYNVMLFATEDNEELDQMLDDTIYASSALLMYTSHLRVMRVLMRNPEAFAARVDSNDRSHVNFATTRDIQSLQNWLNATCVKEPRTARPSSTSQLRPPQTYQRPPQHRMERDEDERPYTPRHQRLSHLVNPAQPINRRTAQRNTRRNQTPSRNRNCTVTVPPEDLEDDAQPIENPYGDYDSEKDSDQEDVVTTPSPKPASATQIGQKRKIAFIKTPKAAKKITKAQLSSIAKKKKTSATPKKTGTRTVFQYTSEED